MDPGEYAYCYVQFGGKMEKPRKLKKKKHLFIVFFFVQKKKDVTIEYFHYLSKN